MCVTIVSVFVLVSGLFTACSTYGSADDTWNNTNFADVACGQTSVGRVLRRGRIVGGKDASPGEFPWIVSLTRSGGHFCGGTIVNKDWILTAAHCICSGTETLGTSSLRVTLGEHDLLSSGDLQLPVKRAFLHPDFRCGRYDSDLALLQLGAAIPWSKRVRPACFPPPGYAPPPRAEALVAGWGWTAESSSKGIRSNILQMVKLSVVDNPTCKAWYLSQGKKLAIKDTQMCAGFEKGGKDACWADSGGPLVTMEDPSMTVVGVVSTGVGCARPRFPGIYTRVSHFMTWITDTLATNTG